MYILENDVQWSPELKEAFKHNITRAAIICNGFEINENNYLVSVEIEENRYISNYGFVGTATARKAEIILLDLDNEINLENQEVTIKIGADYEGDTYYINYGNFIVDKAPEIDETNGQVRVVAYDYMIKFDAPYVSTVTYPCSLSEVLEDVCIQAQVALGSNYIINEDFIVENNQFEGFTLREVLQNIAKCAFSWARIGQDNRLYLDFNTATINVESITPDEYKLNCFKKANEYYGPVNQVTYADSDIEGQEERVQDQSSIAINGLKEIVIYDNLFAYTPEKRQELIIGGYSLLGLEYMPISQLEMIGFAYLDCKDTIQISTIDNETFTSRVFNHKITYNGTLHDSIVTEGTSDTEEAYKNTATDIFQSQQTKAIVDKANKKILLMSQNINEQNEKIGIIQLQYGEILAQISDIADITTSGESSYAAVNLENIVASQPILIKIHPISEHISYLYPRENLYPSSALYMKSRKVRFTNTTTNEVFYWELPTDLWYYSNNIYDELTLTYGDGTDSTVTVTRRCQIDYHGVVSVSPSATTETYSYPDDLNLTDGNYTIDILGYSSGYLYVQLMTTNIYTSQFYTKSQTNSLIRLTSDNINLSVDQKLSNYSNTTEMNSAINLSKSSILNTVSLNYANKTEVSAQLELKVDIDNLVSEINASADTINLTAGRLVITSGNFKIDSLGNITAVGANITGTITTSNITATGGTIGGFTVGNTKLYNGKSSLTASSNGVYIGTDGISCGTGSNFKVTSNGTMECHNAKIIDGQINLRDNGSGGTNYLSIERYENNNLVSMMSAFSNFIGVSKTTYTSPTTSVDTAFAGLYANEYRGSCDLTSDIYMTTIKAEASTSNLTKQSELYMAKINADRIYSSFNIQNDKSLLYMYRNNHCIYCSVDDTNDTSNVFIQLTDGTNTTTIFPKQIQTPLLIQTSRESKKKNIKRYTGNALEIVKNTEIYEYNYKFEDDKDKKHIGVIIADNGGNYKTADEIISLDRQGIDSYTMTSILWKAFQEIAEKLDKIGGK